MKKIRYGFIVIPLFFLLFTAVYLCHGFDGYLFRKMTDSFFIQSMENDALDLHFTLANPKAYGITLKSASLPVYSRQGQLASAQAAADFLERLSHIRPSRLSEKDRYTYDLLYSWLETQHAGQDFTYYEEPLSPSGGMQGELPLLLAEYTLRDKSDVETYLSLLESTGPYLQGLSDFESEKAQAGLFMTRQDAENVVSQCDRIMDKTAIASGTHFLQLTFADRLEALQQQGMVTAREKEGYLAENNRLLSTVVQPAYDKLGDDLLLLSGKGQYDGGLWEMPQGRAYYAWLVQKTTGSTLDMDGIYTILQKVFQQKFENIQTLGAKYRELTGSFPDPTLMSDGFPLSDPSEILSDLQDRMRKDFPSLTELSSQNILCTVRDVDTALEPYTSPAFYMTPPIDDLAHNTICINRASTAAGIELYTTLAHEGYPGHLYQTVYSSLYQAGGNNELPVRELLHYGGYVEGWAYYTERLSYEYAADLLQSSDASSAASLLCTLIGLQRDLQINLFSLLDISLHYYGAKKDDILQSLTSFGLPVQSAERIYHYLRTAPATYLKYYVGYLEMTALKNRAKAQWGDAFTPMRFHRFVLEAGPSDYKNLTKRLQSSRFSNSGTKAAIIRCFLRIPPY